MDGLRSIRATLDDVAFVFELKAYLTGVNDLAVTAEIIGEIVHILRKCSDKSAERKNQLTNIRYGIGSGIAIGATGVVGVATGGTVLVFAVFAGAWMAGMSVMKTGPLSAEEQIYSDIAARTTKIRDKFDV